MQNIQKSTAEIVQIVIRKAIKQNFFNKYCKIP